jgi:GT2 family glycosyltransferase
MIFTRKAFDEVGFFDTDFGAGTKIASAEDLDFLYRALKKHLKMVYAPDVLLYHNHGRRIEAQLHASHRGYLIGRGAFYSKHIVRGDRVILKMASREIAGIAVSLCKEILGMQPKKKRRSRELFNLAMGAIYNLGAMLHSRPYLQFRTNY